MFGTGVIGNLVVTETVLQDAVQEIVAHLVKDEAAKNVCHPHLSAVFAQEKKASIVEKVEAQPARRTIALSPDTNVKKTEGREADTTIDAAMKTQ